MAAVGSPEPRTGPAKPKWINKIWLQWAVCSDLTFPP
jgi:hypothetical protein